VIFSTDKRDFGSAVTRAGIRFPKRSATIKERCAMNIIDNVKPTEELQALDAAHHLHPFTDTKELNAQGVRVISRAKGAWLTDNDGAEILDGMAGLWCVNIGYGRDELAQAAARQMQQLPYYNTFFKTTHPPIVALSARVAELAPAHLNRTFFASSGSEANDTNIRFVRHYWAAQGKPEKRKIISRRNAYHGSSMGSASLGGMQAMHDQGGLPIADIHHIGQPHWWAEGGDMSPEDFGKACARELLQAIETHGEDKIAAFIGEPVQGAGGVIVPPATYWPEIQKICDAHEILLIADEVICGFGRTGNWFGSETYGITPDIMTIAKGLSSGYAPIGGSIISDKVMEVFENTAGEFTHGYTYSGHPVSAAVALENLRILDEEGIVTTAGATTAPYLAQAWRKLGDHPLVGETRVAGMMAAMELTPGKAARAKFDTVGHAGGLCRDAAIAAGLVMRAVGDAMVISPPLIISHSEIDTLVERAWQALDVAQTQLKASGHL
jgi:putrescine aminotransferase